MARRRIRPRVEDRALVRVFAADDWRDPSDAMWPEHTRDWHARVSSVGACFGYWQQNPEAARQSAEELVAELNREYPRGP
jgi:hypothetical protein